MCICSYPAAAGAAADAAQLIPEGARYSRDCCHDLLLPPGQLMLEITIPLGQQCKQSGVLSLWQYYTQGWEAGTGIASYPDLKAW